ncbi:MAG: M64 family metallopeptidase [Saprospiraceae bacterium]
MNKYLTKIFPIFNSPNINNKINIVIFSEGYRLEDKKMFNNKCRALIKKLEFFFPLNSVLKEDSNINIYTCFVPSVQFGISCQSNNKSNTFLNSNIDTKTNEIYIDSDRLLKELDAINFSFSTLFETLTTLIVIIAPPLLNQSNCIEEKQLDITFLGVTRSAIFTISSDGWENSVVRALGSVIGLGDEFGNDSGPDIEQPILGEGVWIDYYCPNLIFFKSPEQELYKEKLKWKALMPKNDEKFEIYESEVIESQLPHKIPYKYSVEKINLWEGGGGYQKKVFRSAQDCIMRRKIGDREYPVRDERMSFCPVCEYVIRYSINQGIKSRGHFFL